MTHTPNIGPGAKKRAPHRTEKPKEFKKTLIRLIKYLRPRRFQLMTVVVAALLSTLFNVVSPKLLGNATSSIFESVTQGSAVNFIYIGQLLVILLGLYLLSAIFSFLQHYIMASVAQLTIAEMRQDVNEKLSRLPIRYFDRHPHGDILSRAVNDIDNINASLQQALTQVIGSIISVLGIIIMMLLISPVLTLIVLLTIPLSLLVARNVAKYSQTHFVNQQAELGNINTHIEEMFTGYQIVKAFGREKSSLETFDKINQRLYKAGWKAQFISGLMMPLMIFVNNLGYVLVSISGAFFVINGSIRLGDVQAFIQYSQQVSQPMGQIAGIANMIQTAIASAERIFLLLDESEEEQQTARELRLDKIQGSVSFRNVCFGYDPQVRVIKSVSLNVDAGQTVAIVGPTGAGKTTISNLLLRFYDPDQGAILIDDLDLQTLTRDQVRSVIAMVLQDTWLFSGTIRENIAYGRREATEDEIVLAAKAAFADDFIRTLPMGYETVLSEDASNISQGQRQLLTIARAILANPKILILDEATSSVDTRTEMHIQSAMQQLMKGRTSFVIAHRLSTIRNADLILVMSEGDIIEQGTHEQLLDKNGFYADLYNSQFSGSHAG